MNWLRVKDWERHQHYKDRKPPWIKLHRELLDDYAFSQLSDAQKGQLIMLWVVASRESGRIPNDPEFLRSAIKTKARVQLKAFIDAGFLIPIASATQAPDNHRNSVLSRPNKEPKNKEIERDDLTAAANGVRTLIKDVAERKGYDYEC